MITKQYDCKNVMQVAFRVAEMTNTYLDCQTWDKYCKEVKKDGSSWIDYTAFDFKGNECDVSILLGYDQQTRQYFVSVDYGKRPISDFSLYECEKFFEGNDYAKMEKELIEPEGTHIEDIKEFKEKSELHTNYEVLADENFHQLTKTLIKSLFKAIGTDETRKIHFIISNNMVFFNYNGMQYKYYPSQCKIFKKCVGKYQRINWKDFVDDNSPVDQKQVRGRSPPLLLI